MATSWTQANLDALEAAIAKGVKSVSYGDRRVDYNTLDEMLKLRATMRDEIASPQVSQAIFAGRVQ